jgi:hypothetical protein
MQGLGGHLRPEVADIRAHVAVGELEPGPGEGIGELLRVLRNQRLVILRVGRIAPSAAMSVVNIIGA